MKRRNPKNKRPNKNHRRHSAATGASENAPTRRALLKNLRTGAIATIVGGGAGWLLINEVRATIREKDLSRIGNGIPAVVQIHDPQCPRCVALQRQARDALCNFSESELQYLVADIRSAEGRKLAAAHGVGHVTLLVFDGSGKRHAVLAGPNKSEHLADAFRRHLAAFGDR